MAQFEGTIKFDLREDMHAGLVIAAASGVNRH